MALEIVISRDPFFAELIIEHNRIFFGFNETGGSMERSITTNMRRVVCGLTLALYLVLLPRPSFGFAFTTLDSNGIPVPNQTTGVPITRESARVKAFLGFGSVPLNFMPSNGSGSWDENALQALQDWNEVERASFRFNGRLQVGNLCAFGNGKVNSGWADNNCGQDLGDAIAVTRIVWRIVGGQAEIDDTDIILNNTLNWDVYDGPIRVGGDGKVIYDFRRTVSHEFGHVLGLGHPDMADQTVDALMNSTFPPGSDTDRLTADDRNGIIALYANSEPQSGSGGSSSFDAGLIALILLVLALRSRSDRKARGQRSSFIGGNEVA